ncbi:MAG TPA: hypothetical protein ENK52_03200 [Saprospiraceae bacterium]|nr:hypothetical protein [Saprospiraceae bacterium]
MITTIQSLSYLLLILLGTPNLTFIEVVPNHHKTIRGYLSEGQTIDTKWANNFSYVNCFPEKDNKKFNGNQLLYILEMPENSALKITAISNKNISMFAYQIAERDSKNIPPHVRDVIHCASSTNNQNNRKKPEFIQLNTAQKPCKVVIGIAGANKINMGAFELDLELVQQF